MEDKTYQKLQEKVSSLLGESPSTAVSFIENEIKTCLDNILIVNSLARHVYTVAECDLSKVEDSLRLDTRIWTNEPNPWINLAEFFIFQKEDLNAASQAIKIALEKANETGNYVRLCYNNMARIAAKSHAYGDLSDFLEFLIEYKPRADAQDIGYEKDFLVYLDQSKMSAPLLKKYLSLFQ